MEKKYILTAEQAIMKIKRMSFEILEKNPHLEDLVLAGVKDNGWILAQHIRTALEEISSIRIEILPIEIDKNNPLECTVPAHANIKNKVVVVVDDVVNSGKTLLYALQPLLKLSPLKLQTLTLVERSYKTFPVHVDYVGVSLSSTFEDHIVVAVKNGELEGAYLE